MYLHIKKENPTLLAIFAEERRRWSVTPHVIILINRIGKFQLNIKCRTLLIMSVKRIRNFHSSYGIFLKGVAPIFALFMGMSFDL